MGGGHVIKEKINMGTVLKVFGWMECGTVALSTSALLVLGGTE